jgi:hypothetical protein
MRSRLTLTAALGAVLVAGSILAAAPAHAASPYTYVQDSVGLQYDKTCASSSTCNTITPGAVDVEFGRTGSTAQALGIYYKIINGTAVNGVDFNTPATGEEIIAAGQYIGDLSVPAIYEGMFGTSKYFTIAITGTSSPITIQQSTATGTIEGGNVPPDCSFTHLGGSSLAMDCTGRPPTQVWNLAAQCGLGIMQGGARSNDVTGDGTSTGTCSGVLRNPLFNIDS